MSYTNNFHLSFVHFTLFTGGHTMKNNALILSVLVAIVALSISKGLSQSGPGQDISRPDVWPLRPMPTSHVPRLSALSTHPSFYDRKAEWQSIIRQFWGPGESLAGKLATFDLYQNYARAYNSTFVWNLINWDSLASVLRSRITDSTSRGEFSRILNDLAFGMRDGHAHAYDNVMLTTPLNPGTPILADGGGVINHFGAGLTPLADSSLLVYKVVPNHPLGLVPGDRILGYQGIPWRQLVRELFEGEVPNTLWIGAAPSAYARTFLSAAGESWHLFDTIDVVKHSTGQTVHLPLDSMVTLSAPGNYINNEQLPVSGVPMPVFNEGAGAVTYGIIQGTNIGYIYVYHHIYAGVSPEFDAAVQALMGTDGLIIDLRVDWGGSYGLNNGISRLMNHETSTMDARRRCSPGDLFSLCPFNPYWWNGEIPVDIGTYYDRPIAVLLGPLCVSYGDISSWQLSYISNVRTFGRSPAAVYSGYSGISQPSRTGYSMLCPNLTMVDHFAPNVPRWGQEYPLDEEVWLTPGDVANGYDNVVGRARAWIEHAAYANRVRVMSTYARPGLDSNTVTARLNNPDGHNTRLTAFVKNELGVLIDSLGMFDDGLHGDSLAGDGVYGARIAPPATEGQYSVSLTTYDLTNGIPYKLTQAVHYFSSGPVEVVGRGFGGSDTVPRPGEALSMRLLIRNQGLLDTLENIVLNVVPLDAFITCNSFSNSIAALLPGSAQWTGYAFGLSINPSTPGETDHAIQVTVYPNMYPAWTDTLLMHVSPSVQVTPALSGVLYGASTYLYTVSTDSGAATSIGQIGQAQIQGLAVRPTTRELYGISSGDPTSFLYRIYSERGHGVVDRFIPVAGMRAIAFSPGDTLYGATTSGNLYRIDLARDTAIAIGPSSGRAYSGLSFSPRTGKLWASVREPSDNDSLFIVDRSTGTATFAFKAGWPAIVPSIAFTPGDTLYGLLGDGGTYLIRMDSTGSQMIGETWAERVDAIAMYGLVVSVDEPRMPLIPQTFTLHQNYPNPFNPSTTIRYGLPNTSQVSVVVYNTLGQHVAQLVNEQQQAGYHDVVFRGDGLASGVYFYRIQAGDFVASKKLLLLK